MKWVVAPVVIMLALGAALWATAAWGEVPAGECWNLRIERRVLPEPVYLRHGECIRGRMAVLAETCESQEAPRLRTACYESLERNVACIPAECPPGMKGHQAP